jgi:hypothetical protein
MRWAVKWPALSPRDRRALRLGALVVGPVFAWTLAVAPYVRTERALRAQVGSERALLAREMGLRAAESELRLAATDGARRMDALMPLLFDEGRGGLVSAAVGEYVQEAAEGARVRLEEMAPRDRPAASGGLRPVALAVAGRGELRGVVGLLTRLTAGTKLVQVDSVEIQPAAPGGRPARDPLAFRVVVTGYTLDGGAAAPPAARPTSLAHAPEGR